MPSPELIVTSSNDQDEEEEDDDDDDLCLDGESGLTKAHVMTCRICQLFVRTVDRLLDKSEELMDQYLPLTEAEIGKEMLECWVYLGGETGSFGNKFRRVCLCPKELLTHDKKLRLSL